MGGLGNQMFQISKALSEGILNNIDVFFRPNAFIPMEGNQPSKYMDNIFRNLKFKDTTETTERINEISFSYNEMDILYFKPIEFYGYFQSSKNFKNNENIIKNIFKPTDEFKEKLKTKYPKIFEDNSVSIHVRRGDYLGISHVLPVIDKTYIDESLNKITNKSHIFIFSNDKNWVRDNLNYEESTIVEGLEDYEELWSISFCQNNIMSNSSFSWWGSYLNDNPKKKVFVPSIWFGPGGEKNFQDVYEEDWEKINVYYKNGKLLC
jgi:hypothetical protein